MFGVVNGGLFSGLPFAEPERIVSLVATNPARGQALALAVDRAVLMSRQDEWRTNPFKVKKVRIAIKGALKDRETLTDQVLELVTNQHEY